MGMLANFAETLAGQLVEAQFEGGLRPSDIAGILGFREEINCYPGVPGAGCHDTAIFVSLSSSNHRGKHRGHLTCRQAIEKLVQHMQGSCEGITQEAALIVDSWDAEAAGEWRANLKRIENQAHLEIYLVAGRSVSPIQI